MKKGAMKGYFFIFIVAVFAISFLFGLGNVWASLFEDKISSDFLGIYNNTFIILRDLYS